MRIVPSRFKLKLALLSLLVAVPAVGLVILLAAGRRGSEAIAVVSLVAILLLAAMWAGGHLFIVRGLKVLLGATERLAAGDLTARTGLTDDHGQIGTLARLFDEVADALQGQVAATERQSAALRLAHEELERRVSERTAQLASANEQLEAEIVERRRTDEELRKAIEAAKAAMAAKGSFLACMSHEIRTPLNGVTGMIGLLRNTPLNDQQSRYVEVARTAADSLLVLISDILDFSKLEANGVELEAAPFNPRELVETSMEAFAPRAAQKGLELACHFSADVPAVVRGDPHRLRQVINNLLSNAMKFTERGQITFRASVERQINSHIMLSFAVTDTGIGISAAGMQRLFQPFSQAEASTTRKFGGTGLGLAISKGLVELMGGQIEVESVEGQGTTFRFTLVLEKETAAQTPWGAIPDELRRMRVLVADHNAASRAITQEHLSSWGIETMPADDAASAVSLLKRAADDGKPFGMVIAEADLAGVDAAQLATAICESGVPTAHRPILLATVSIDEPRRAAEWKALGFAGCVSKPLLPSRLLDAVTMAVAPSGGRSVRGGSSHSMAPTSEALRDVRILLAEDNEVNQLVATEILAAAGFRCDLARNGREAVEATANKAYHLVLMDCQMPEMDGLTATRLIRQREAEAGTGTRRNVILALTANASKSDREQCLAAGMDGYLTKPIDPPQLIAAIQSLFPDGVQALPAAEIAPANAPANESAAIDLPGLLGRCMNNVPLVGKLLGKFEQQLTHNVEELERTIAGGDEAAATAVAHSLKGAAASMCAAGLRAIAADIEQCLRGSDAAGAARHLPALRDEVRRCVASLPALRGELFAGQSAPAATTAADVKVPA